VNWNRVALSDVQPSPWRNGGGVTRELLAWPTTQNWLWRMSVAEVAQSGPFSRFEGVQRWLAVLSGAGVRLSVDGHAQELTRDSAPFQFDGATTVQCELINGATQDFNLMLRGDGTARMQRLAGTHGFLLNCASTVAIYANSGEVRVDVGRESTLLAPHTLGWRTLPADAVVRVQADDALWMEMAA
jgi:environmental stress-induced protein Ves